jgi:hypothetical protein
MRFAEVMMDYADGARRTSCGAITLTAPFITNYAALRPLRYLRFVLLTPLENYRRGFRLQNPPGVLFAVDSGRQPGNAAQIAQGAI